MKTSHILEIKEENGYQYIELPNSLRNKMGWKIGDTIDWKDNKDGTWSLIKIAENPNTKKKKQKRV